MYSVVLMVAVTSGMDAPDFGRHNSGCYGCQGAGYGGNFGCYGGRGCYGGVYGGCYSGGYGCYSGGYGCYSGGYGCYSGGYGSGYGCYGGSYGCYGGGIGSYGGRMGYGSAYIPQNTFIPYGPIAAGQPLAMGAPSATAVATLIVDLPENAALTIDGYTTKSTSSQRRFVSPPLNRNESYTYTLQATVMRDGAPITLTKEVAVRPGQETRIQLEVPTTGVADGR